MSVFRSAMSTNLRGWPLPKSLRSLLTIGYALMENSVQSWHHRWIL
jgi:hypothetical protein